MSRICVFAGTTEGRELVCDLLRQSYLVTCVVATEYGESLFDEAPGLELVVGRKDQLAMEQLLKDSKPEMVVDTTHPYATVVSDNLKKACANTGIDYVRLLRDAQSPRGDSHYVSSFEEALHYLETTEGNILFSTGSKDLHLLKGRKALVSRSYVRVLPMKESLSLCEDAGIKPSHIIALQGPFSTEYNALLLREKNIRYMVTKEGGTKGGFAEKIEACSKEGVTPVVLGMPRTEQGLSYDEVLQYINRTIRTSNKKKVSIVGIGPAGSMNLTARARQVIMSGDSFIGAKRMLAIISDEKPKYEAISPFEINAFIESSEHAHHVVLMSGDVGFFSGAKKLIDMLNDQDTELIAGISSLVYFCSKIGTSYEDIHLYSLHGREQGILPLLQKKKRVFVLVGGTDGMKRLCEKLSRSNLELSMWIGENLGYDDERIHQGSPEEFLETEFSSLSVAIIENKATRKLSVGIDDESFIRQEKGQKVIPMTKSEVRALIHSKLQLEPDSICWDVGAGTGSVSVEMALASYEGVVHAIEKNERAVELLEQNRDRFSLDNLIIHQGRTPEACTDLPAPTHVFIGGSTGSLREILEVINTLNPQCRVVATAVSLEAISELSAILKDFSWERSDVLTLSVARGDNVGDYHLMRAQNPVTIFSFKGIIRD